MHWPRGVLVVSGVWRCLEAGAGAAGLCSPSRQFPPLGVVVEEHRDEHRDDEHREAEGGVVHLLLGEVGILGR